MWIFFYFQYTRFSFKNYIRKHTKQTNYFCWCLCSFEQTISTWLLEQHQRTLLWAEPVHLTSSLQRLALWQPPFVSASLISFIFLCVYLYRYLYAQYKYDYSPIFKAIHIQKRSDARQIWQRYIKLLFQREQKEHTACKADAA